jgi:hypothetical protein
MPFLPCYIWWTKLFILLLQENVVLPTSIERLFLVFLTTYSLASPALWFSSARWSCDLHGRTAPSRYCMAGHVPSGLQMSSVIVKCFRLATNTFWFPHQNYQHIIIPTALRQHSVSRISFSIQDQLLKSSISNKYWNLLECVFPS